MPQLKVSSYTDTAEARQELIAFLEEHWRPRGDNHWQQRMRLWWDENPAARDNEERGRQVHQDGRMVAYGGAIPAQIAWQGEQLQAVQATTLCVDESVPKAAALVFLKQREIAQVRMLTHTTPNPRVQAALLKMGARCETSVTRHYFPAGAASWLRGRHWWPSLPAGKTLITNPAAVTALVRPYQKAERIEKWITPEYLRWFCSLPTRKHHILGLVDGAGVLSSYLLVTPARIKGFRAWEVLEAFSTAADDDEALALMGQLVRTPSLLPGGAALVTAATFVGDTVWDRAPAVLRRAQQVCHFFLMTERLRDAPKHSVMAEGDMGL